MQLHNDNILGNHQPFFFLRLHNIQAKFSHKFHAPNVFTDWAFHVFIHQNWTFFCHPFITNGLHFHIIFVRVISDWFSMNSYFKSMVFIILQGCFPCSNVSIIRECECTNGTYGSYYGWHYLCAFFPALVSRHHCVPIHHIHHDLGDDPPLYNIWSSKCVLLDAPVWFSSTRNTN